MDSNTIQKKVVYIKTVRKAYLDQLSVLEQKQQAILNNFSEALREKKLAEIKKTFRHLYGTQ